MRLSTFLPLVFLAACSARTPAPDATPRTITGDWGGAHIGLQLHADGGTVDYDCAHGTIDAPLRVDAAGRFRVEGQHVREHGGPARVGEVLPREPATYEGVVAGNRMTLRVRTESMASIPYELELGAPARLLKCL